MISFNPDFVFQKFSIFSYHTSADGTNFNSNINDHDLGSNTPLQTRYFTGQILPILINIKKVFEVEKLVSLFRNQTLDSPKFRIFYKTEKTARFAIADRVVLNCTNTELFVANTKKKQQTEQISL